MRTTLDSSSKSRLLVQGGLAARRSSTKKRTVMFSPRLRLALVFCLATAVWPQDNSNSSRPEIPRIWDERALQEMELPVVVPKYSPKAVPADYYYKIPVRTIYKSYPIYAPGRAPAGYLEKLKSLEPEVAIDETRLKTEQDWIRAGEGIFEAPTAYDEAYLNFQDVSDPKWYAQTGVRLTSDGIMPYARYVVRKKGKVEVGNLSCAMCHTRVLADGAVIKAGQGNFPLDHTNAFL